MARSDCSPLKSDKFNHPINRFSEFSNNSKVARCTKGNHIMILQRNPRNWGCNGGACANK